MHQNKRIMDYFAQYQLVIDFSPRPAVNIIQHENSQYCNYADRVKDCYLLSSALEDERCFYGRNIFYSFDCVDCADTHNSELCYECVTIKKCYNLNFSQDCEQCADSEYLKECKSCQSCFCCINLKHKKYYIFNKPYSQDDYKNKVAYMKSQGQNFIEKEFEKFKEISPHIAIHGSNNENSIGDYLSNSKNCFNVFESKESQDCMYSYELLKCEDCLDITIGEFSKLNYDCVSSYKLNNSNFCYNCWESSDLEYCEYCFQCEHCLFCASLKHKRFHIFNKPYSSEEYFALKTKIIAELKASGMYGKHTLSTYPFDSSMAAEN